ncbi:MAG: periplasmic protein TonB [Pyrinomonadaceae bacterium]|jgi:TonB family protein|nr:periplasmic protein TonB [Pyrinomonadaceae bacterium]
MKYTALKVSSLALLMLTWASFLSAQSSVKTIEWETLRPDGEAFSVQMPKGSTAQSSKETYHKFELNTSVYVSQLPGGPVFAVVALSGIKSNPAMYSEMERLNSYVDAFKNLFPPKIRPKGAVAKLTLVGDKVLQGNPGREYRLTVRSSQPATAVSEPELSGTAQVFATKKRFYAVVFLNNKKDDELQEQFLSSFLIPERIAPAATVAAQPPAEQPQVQKASSESRDAPAAEVTAAEAAAAAPSAGEASDVPHSKKRGPISGGVLNGKALYLPQPEYPAAAKAAGTAGTVVVRITIDEQGNVISATAVSGPPALQQVSVNAATQAKFAPTLLVGEPVQVVGIITYNFIR